MDDRMLQNLNQKFEQLVDGGYTGKISTGFENIDSIIGGFEKGKISLIAGRPGMLYKTLAQNMVLSILRENQFGVLYFSFCTPKKETYVRLLGMILGTNSRKFLTEQRESTEIKRVSDAMNELSKLQLHIEDDDKFRNLDMLIPYCQKAKAERNVQFVVIDDLQCIGSKTVGSYLQLNLLEKKEKELALLRKLAKDSNLHVLLLSSLPQYVDFRNGHKKRPKLIDIYNLGLSSAMFDTILLTYRPDYYGIDHWDFDGQLPTRNLMEVLAYKSDISGRVPMKYDLRSLRIKDYNTTQNLSQSIS